MPKTRTWRRPANSARGTVGPWCRHCGSRLRSSRGDFIVEKEAEQWLGNLLSPGQSSPPRVPDGGGPPRTVVECDHIRKRLNRS